MKKQMTLCLIHQHPRVLLAMKKRGFGEGRWNGFGGKVEGSETIEEAAKREGKEELGIEITNFDKLGIIEFEFEAKKGEILEVHVFKIHEFSGEPTESEEMKPQWFFIDEIPFREMWPDDIYWMPHFIKNRKFRGKFLFGEGGLVLESDLKQVDSL